MKDKKVTAEIYNLTTENGGWLGQIVITSDGMFASVTDYGNFSYAWRSFGCKEFREFLKTLDVHYFAGKMFQSANTHHSRYNLKDLRRATELFAEKILPVLQEALKQE